MVAFEEVGVINPDGLGAVVSGMVGVYYLQWVTEEEAKIVGIDMLLNVPTIFSFPLLCQRLNLFFKVRDAEKADSIEAPNCPYKIQPGNKG